MDILTYIAYLVGDSKRVVLPTYQPGPLNLPSTQSSVNFVMNNPLSQVHEINHPEGVSGIVGEGMVAQFVSEIGWVGNLHTLIPGESYTLLYNISETTSTIVYGYQDIDYQSLGTFVPQHVFENWLRESMIKISKLMPRHLRLHMIGSKNFTAGEITTLLDWEEMGLQEPTSATIPLASLGSSDIISVVWYDGDIAYECRQIPFYLRSKSKFGSGFLEECSETDPIYYIDNNKNIIVEPSPDETGVYHLDGFCQIDYIDYPNVNINEYNISGVPADVQEIIFLDTAIKVKRFEINSLEVPETPVLDSQFKAIELDNPNTIDAIEKAQYYIDNLQGLDFKDNLNREDLEMSLTALKGSNAELEIANVQLSEQDRRSGHYLSQYSQDISKFSQMMESYMARSQKKNAEMNDLNNKFQEGLYALRGELPSKQQLGEADEKLETIRQVLGQ